MYYLHAFALSIPHPDKVATGGEDAYFLGTFFDSAGTNKKPVNGPQDVLCFGVADGVGSWFEQGISAGKVSVVFQVSGVPGINYIRSILESS